jgi:hypothetical protein
VSEAWKASFEADVGAARRSWPRLSPALRMLARGAAVVVIDASKKFISSDDRLLLQQVRTKLHCVCTAPSSLMDDGLSRRQRP